MPDAYQPKQAQNHWSRKEKILGQFFTPPEVAEFIASFALQHITEGKTACDPACGDGVFISSLIRHGFKPLGVDIDQDVANCLPDTIKQYVIVQNGLTISEEQQFDIVVGNPPFSSKYGRIKGDILNSFELGQGFSSQAIEILFLEKFIRLCRENGVIGIILPHGIFSDLRLSYVREYIMKHLKVIAIISLPRNIFRTNKTSSKTCVLIGVKKANVVQQKILFAVVNSINELSEGEIHQKVITEPEEFLYPEFYIEKNPIIDKLPKLKDLNIQMIQGSTKYGSKRIFSSTGIPFISAKTITPLGIDFSKENKFIEPGGIMDNKKSHVTIGDIVFVRVGVGCIGRCALISATSEEGIADDWIYIIRSKDKRINSFYLYFWLQTNLIQKEIKRLARGVGTITIPITMVKELPIMIPNPSILQECENIYYQIISKREKQQVEAIKIKNEMCAKLERELYTQL